MPLDPQIQNLVNAANAAASDAPSIWDQSVQDRRESYIGLSSLPGPGPDIDQVENVVIAGVPCRRYANHGATGCFVFIHGGGYTIGDLDTHDQPCRQLALESAANVISVDYRLAPEHPFPAGINDAWEVLQTIDADRTTYGADAGVVVGGDSAGGNFAAVLALMARDAGIKLAAQLLIYPAVNARDNSPSMTDNGTGYILTSESMAWFNKQYAADPDDWRASPIKAASHKDLAPALVITAEFDPLRDQGAAYARTLESAGVSVSYNNYKGMVHAFFQLGPICDAGARAVSEVANAARDALNKNGT